MNSAMATKSPRARRSAQEWRAVMAQYARSGLSQDGFCAREGIAPSTFARWRAQLRAEGVTTSRVTPEAASPFVELVSSASSPAFDIELELGCGVVLRMRSR